ncbi:hypothetical protein CFC21_017092 [Triticum aestivum]|uniref:Uncharacterized protein n=2 Tax=Triticum aestivum TaxID=4565 RepID=A0A3B6AYQ9_WHEAT|nr:hypothetical protein CFC21_017092 [Triticum aestivum]
MQASDGALDVPTIPRLHVKVSAPQHDPSVVLRPVHDGQHLGHQRVRIYVPAALVRRLPLRRQPEADRALGQALGPVLPRCLERSHVAGPVAAHRVVVELDMHAVEEPRPERLPQPLVRERALRRCRDQHLLLALPVAVGLEVPGEVVVVGLAPELDVEVDAVQHGVAERPGVGLPAEVVVPEVVGHILGVGLGGEGVLSNAAADGEQDEDFLRLAVLDVVPDVLPGVAGEVELVLAAAEVGQEGEDDGGVELALAGLAERPLAGGLALWPQYTVIRPVFPVAAAVPSDDRRMQQTMARVRRHPMSFIDMIFFFFSTLGLAS